MHLGGWLSIPLAVAIAVLGVVALTVPRAGEFTGGPAGRAGDDPTMVIDGLADDALGERWTVVGGVWSVEGGTATLISPPDGQGAPGIAVADLGTPMVWIAATIGDIAPGWGLVSRYLDAGNYDVVLADPRFASLRLLRVVEGEQQVLGMVSPAATRRGAVVRVEALGTVTRLLVDGKVVLEVVEESAGGGTGVGLYGAASAAGIARWVDVRAGLTDP